MTVSQKRLDSINKEIDRLDKQLKVSSIEIRAVKKAFSNAVNMGDADALSEVKKNMDSIYGIRNKIKNDWYLMKSEKNLLEVIVAKEVSETSSKNSTESVVEKHQNPREKKAPGEPILNKRGKNGRFVSNGSQVKEKIDKDTDFKKDA